MSDVKKRETMAPGCLLIQTAVVVNRIVLLILPNKDDTYTHYLTNLGPPFTTLAQHWSNIVYMCPVCWILVTRKRQTAVTAHW